MEEIQRELGLKLSRQAISPRVLLDRLRMLDDNSRKTGQYQDPNYLPFYYHLSKFFSPKSVLNVGLDLGLPLCCFISGGVVPERICLFQRRDESFYSPRIAISNIRDVAPKASPLYHRGLISDREIVGFGGLDMVLVTGRYDCDEVREVLDVCWELLNLDGVVVLDHARGKAGEVFDSFCRAQNRPHVRFDTRYGHSTTQK
jgi:hypothetical protein